MNPIQVTNTNSNQYDVIDLTLDDEELMPIEQAVGDHNGVQVKKYVASKWLTISEQQRRDCIRLVMSNFDPVELEDILELCPTEKEEFFELLMSCVDLQYHDLAAHLLCRANEGVSLWFTAKKRTELLLKAKESGCTSVEQILLSPECLVDVMEGCAASKELFVVHKALDNKTLLQWIYDHKDSSLFTALIGYCEPTSVNMQELIFFCLEHKEEEAALELLSLAQNIPQATMQEIFILALQKGFKGVVRRLISKKVNIHFGDPKNGLKTPLMVAAEYRWKEEIIALLKKGALLTVYDAAGKSAFDYIVESFSDNYVFVYPFIPNPLQQMQPFQYCPLPPVPAIQVLQPLSSLSSVPRVPEVQTAGVVVAPAPAGINSVIEAAKAKQENLVLQFLAGNSPQKRLFATDTENKRAIDYIKENLGLETIQKIADIWDCHNPDTCDFMIYLIENNLKKNVVDLLSIKRSPLRPKRDGIRWKKNELSKLFIKAVQNSISMTRFVLRVNPLYADENGITPVMAVVQQKRCTEFSRFARKGIDVTPVDNNGVSLLQMLQQSIRTSKVFAKSVLASWEITRKETPKFLIDVMDSYIDIVQNTTGAIKMYSSSKFEWDEADTVALFCKALEHNDAGIAIAVLSLLPPLTKHNDQFLILAAAEKRMQSVVEAFVAKGASVTEVVSNAETILHHLQKYFDQSAVKVILKQVPSNDNRNKELVTLLFQLQLKEEACSILEMAFVRHHKKFIDPESAAARYFEALEEKKEAVAKALIPFLDLQATYKGDKIFVATCKLGAIDVVRAFFVAEKFFEQVYDNKPVIQWASDYFKNEKPEFVQELSLLYKSQAVYFEKLFSSYGTTREHMLYTFKNIAAIDVKPMPANFSLTGALQEILNYITPSWSNAVTVQDDTMFITKDDAIRAISSFIDKLEKKTVNGIEATNQTLLQQMYGNIFAAILALPKGTSDLKIRSFLQSLGATLSHCSDRKIMDSIRYYHQFVDNKVVSVEQQEQASLEESIHQELLKMRKKVFHDAYFAVDTDGHDAATERDLSYLFDQQLGLHLPAFNNRDDHRNYSLRQKQDEVLKGFYDRYTPAYIAKTLGDIISDAIKNDPKQTWYLSITKYFESTQPTLDIHTIYDVERSCFTADCIKKLLVDFKIIQTKIAPISF